MNRFLLSCLLAFALGNGPAAFANSEGPDGITYKSGPLSMMRLGRDIYGGLRGEARDQIHVQPVAIEADLAPFMRLTVVEEEGRKLGAVAISAGFIDLVNRIAHAKAIDGKVKGYFQRYVLSLEGESIDRELRPLPNDTEPKYWTEAMLNEQLSNFNSIVGMMAGIKLAHHTLGHFQKYEPRLTAPDGKPVPINTLLAPEEWEDALKAGTRIAMGAGCTIEGVLPFFECFEKMTVRPAWADYFVPPQANYKDIRKTLQRVQTDVFSGK